MYPNAVDIQSIFKSYVCRRAIPNRPESYFKYMNAEVAKIVLVNQKLRWSSPHLLDDPFDVQRCFSLGFDAEELREPLCQEIMGLLLCDRVPDLSGKPHVERLVKCLRRSDHVREYGVLRQKLGESIGKGIQQAEIGVIRKKWSELLPQFRILCFSAVHDNVQMWSHYADSHKGVVLEFQPRDDSSFLWASVPVTYQDSPPMIASKEEWVKSITGQEPLTTRGWQLFMPLTVTKTTGWKYQEEWRVVTFMRKGESGLYSDYPFNARELRSVYLGCEISEQDTDDVIALLRYNLAHVAVHRGRRVEQERSLSFARAPRGNH